MRWRRTAVPTAAAAALVAMLIVPTTVSAAKPITGKLSKRGYRVIALDASGQGKSVLAKRGRFRLKPPANRVTLHLRAPNGTYAGPIVVRGVGGAKGDKQAKSSRRKGKGKNRVIVGVKAGARLGKIKVNPGKGFALARAVATRSLDPSRSATAKKGVPIGASNFGRVRVKKLKGPGSDRDGDGIPTPLDIDDDGDLILDDVDANTAGTSSALAAQAPPGPGERSELGATAGLFLGFQTPTAIVNANAPGLSDEQVQSGLVARGTLGVSTALVTSAELNCTGLIYCSPGGTGLRLASQFDPNPQPFPECCDSDHDGFGSLGDGVPPSVQLQTRAGADEIRGGQLLIAHATTSGGEQRDLTVTLNTVFVTVPAIASYVDELGATHPVSYPVAPFTEFPVVDGPDAGSDVSVTLTFWRPQRRPIPDELPPGAGSWVDIGGLGYIASADTTPEFCPLSSYSGTSPNLSAGTGPAGGFSGPIPRLSDSALDQAAGAANTFTYTLNLTDCLAFRGGTFPTSALRDFGFAAAFPVGSMPGVPNVTASSYLFRHDPS